MLWPLFRLSSALPASAQEQPSQSASALPPREIETSPPGASFQWSEAVDRHLVLRGGLHQLVTQMIMGV